MKFYPIILISFLFASCANFKQETSRSVASKEAVYVELGTFKTDKNSLQAKLFMKLEANAFLETNRGELKKLSQDSYAITFPHENNNNAIECTRMSGKYKCEIHEATKMLFEKPQSAKSQVLGTLMRLLEDQNLSEESEVHSLTDDVITLQCKYVSRGKEISCSLDSVGQGYEI